MLVDKTGPWFERVTRLLVPGAEVQRSFLGPVYSGAYWADGPSLPGTVVGRMFCINILIAYRCHIFPNFARIFLAPWRRPSLDPAAPPGKKRLHPATLYLTSHRGALHLRGA